MKFFSFDDNALYENIYTKGTYKYNAFNGVEFEMNCVRSHSKKTKVSVKGEIDNFTIRISKNGKKIPIPYENKTNGGRINTTTCKYIAYSLRDCKSSCWSGYCNSGVFFMLTETFKNILEKSKSLKAINHNGKQDGIAIQLKKSFLRELEKAVYNERAIYFNSVEEFKTAVINVDRLA